MSLPASRDYYRLRREGVGHLERSTSTRWTDYNLHDPGITLLELLSYAITDLGYRTAFPVPELLARDGAEPYRDQAFFSARRILTVNPTTIDDYRRLLADLDGVRNAWLTQRRCPYEAPYYAWCEDGRAVQGYDPDQAKPPAEPVRVTPAGRYGVLLELEDHPELGDLNDRTIRRRRVVVDADGRRRVVTLEVRFPAWGAADQESRARLRDDDGPVGVAVSGPFRTTGGTTQVTDEELQKHWSSTFYVDVVLTLSDQTTVTLPDATLRLYGDADTRRATTVQGDVSTWLNDAGPDGFVDAYRRKLGATDAAVERARQELEAHRNLAEDFSRLEVVEVEALAACAEVRVEPGVDIELVQARIWFEIERYLEPSLEFRTVDELAAAGAPTEAIFNGPELDHGFLTDAALTAAELRTEVRVSDLLDRLIDIEGVLSVDGLVLTGYDAMGLPIRGAADPEWVAGAPPVAVFDPTRSGATWVLHIAPNHRPRLHHGLSRFVFRSAGLPYLPRLDEAEEILVQLHGQSTHPKVLATDLDLAAPTGRDRRLDTYQPLHHSLPPAYGIGPAGLPSGAGPARRAQAKQLAAYLMVFEQVLRNAHAQLAHVGDLFSLDPTVRHTYFPGHVDPALLAGYDAMFTEDVAPRVDGLVETRRTFVARRNRFLDHLLARFGEGFGEFALLLTDLEGQAKAHETLIDDKLAFLRALPRLAHDRGRAMNRALGACRPGNVPGLKERVHLRLGLPDWTIAQLPAVPPGDASVVVSDHTGPLISFHQLTERALLAHLIQRERYAVVAVGSRWGVVVSAPDGTPLSLESRTFATERLAEAFVDQVATWAAHRRAIVVEHLLLRPKFPGDALYPICGGGCGCADDDPYSFRLTYVMPGWTRPFSTDMSLRRFADHTIQAETPSHLVVKTCWVGDDGYLPDPCDPVVSRVAAALDPEGALTEPTCTCAAEIHAAFAEVFRSWHDTHVQLDEPADVVAALLRTAFADVDLSAVSCQAGLDADTRERVDDVLVPHFTELALRGYQFERFEDAWCSWATADAAFDWSRERLHDAVLDLLAGGLGEDDPTPSAEALCCSAATVLARVGTEFRTWMDARLAAGTPPDDAAVFQPALPVASDGVPLSSATAASVRDYLSRRYTAYVPVSHRLSLLLRRLDDLGNTYPHAHLRDCGGGPDTNPVRLGQTALGSN